MAAAGTAPGESPSVGTAVEAGDPGVQNGRGLAIGSNLLSNTTEARKRLSEAAAQGRSDAQFALGNLCYSISMGTRAAQASSAARIEAYMWYHLAGAQGHVGAVAACEMLNLQLSDIELQEGNRRANAFQAGNPALQNEKGTDQHEVPRN